MGATRGPRNRVGERVFREKMNPRTRRHPRPLLAGVMLRTKALLIGTNATRWSEAMLADRGIEGRPVCQKGVGHLRLLRTPSASLGL